MYLVVKTNLNHTSKDNPKEINPTGVLVLEDGAFFQGYGFGYEGIATGEVCFNTSITGYQEIITDPSYAGQIINFTFPHIGNVGTNNEDNESDKIWAKGVIFNTDVTSPSNYRSIKNYSSSPNLIRFMIIIICSNISYVRKCEINYLTRIRRIRNNFLIARY